MKVVQSHRKSNSNNIIVSTLPLYRSAPPLEVRHEDFELFAMDCLRGISDGLRRGKKSEEIKKLRALMSEFKLPYKAVSNAEFESLKDKLGRVACSMGQTLAAVDAIFYKKMDIYYQRTGEGSPDSNLLCRSWKHYVQAIWVLITLSLTKLGRYLSRTLIILLKLHFLSVCVTYLRRSERIIT